MIDTGFRDVMTGDFRRHAGSLAGAHVPWVRVLRQRALERFCDAGMPDMSQEEWRYTDVRPIVQRRFTRAAPPASEGVRLWPFSLSDGIELVFLDGYYQPALSHGGHLPAGVQVASLRETLARGAAPLEPWFGRQLPAEPNGFAALNAAFAEDGAFVRVDAEVAVGFPIHLMYVSSGTADSVSYVRNLVVAERGSRVDVVESYVSLGDAAYLTNSVTEVVLAPEAQVTHYRVGRESEVAYHVGGTYVRQGRASRYASHHVVTGGRTARTELVVGLDEADAACTLDGLYAGRGRQHLDTCTRVEHRMPRGTSREWYKGILDGHARGAFTGYVVVHPQAQKTDAEQANHNLLLSDTAEADSRPQLEIYADDVKCAHGSTVGNLDPDALFYLRSRALDEALARRLLVHAFAADVLARIRLAPLREQLERHLAERLALPPGVARTAATAGAGGRAHDA
jgi:Fe-S cluster assembly protein SufD